MEKNTQALVAAQLAGAMISSSRGNLTSMEFTEAQMAVKLFYAVAEALKEQETKGTSFFENAD